MRNTLPTYTEIIDPIVEPYVNIIQQLVNNSDIREMKKSKQIHWMVKQGIRLSDIASIYDVSTSYVGQIVSNDKHKGNEA